MLVHLTVTNWHDSLDQEGVKYRVARRVCGISQEERKLLLESTDPDARQRGLDYHRGDEDGTRNPQAYCWETFGSEVFTSTDVDWWTELQRSNRRAMTNHDIEWLQDILGKRPTVPPLAGRVSTVRVRVGPEDQTEGEAAKLCFSYQDLSELCIRLNRDGTWSAHLGQ